MIKSSSKNMDFLKSKIELFNIYEVKIIKKINKNNFLVELFGVSILAYSNIDFKKSFGLVQIVSKEPLLHLKILNPICEKFDKSIFKFIKKNEINLSNSKQIFFYNIINEKLKYEKINEYLTLFNLFLEKTINEETIQYKQVIKAIIEEKLTWLNFTSNIEKLEEFKFFVIFLIEKVILRNNLYKIKISSNYNIFKILFKDKVFIFEQFVKTETNKMVSYINSSIFNDLEIIFFVKNNEISIKIYVQQEFLIKEILNLKKEIIKIFKNNNIILIHYSVESKLLFSREKEINNN